MVWSGRFAGLALVLAASASSPGAAQQAIAGVFRRGLTVAEGSRHGPLIEMGQQGEGAQRNRMTRRAYSRRIRRSGWRTQREAARAASAA